MVGTIPIYQKIIDILEHNQGQFMSVRKIEMYLSGEDIELLPRKEARLRKARIQMHISYIRRDFPAIEIESRYGLGYRIK